MFVNLRTYLILLSNDITNIWCKFKYYGYSFIDYALQNKKIALCEISSEYRGVVNNLTEVQTHIFFLEYR